MIEMNALEGHYEATVYATTFGQKLQTCHGVNEEASRSGTLNAPHGPLSGELGIQRTLPVQPVLGFEADMHALHKGD